MTVILKSVVRVILEYVGWFRVPMIWTVRLVDSAIRDNTLIEKPVAENDDTQDVALRADELTVQVSFGDASPKFGNSSTPVRWGKVTVITEPAGILYEGVKVYV